MYQIESGAYTGASPVVDGDRAYFGTFNFEVLALDLTPGASCGVTKRDDARFPYYSSAALDGDLVIVGGAGQGGARHRRRYRRTRLDVRDAGPRRLVPVRGRRPRVHRIGRRRLYVLDAASGKKIWEFDTGARPDRIPCRGRRKVVIGAQDGRLYVFG